MTLKVLIVDDEALARSRLVTLLGDCADQKVEVVAQAANAVEAMQVLQHRAVDLVFLDIHMPGCDGVALAKAMKSLAQSPLVVFVTAHVAHAVEAFELEALDYLTKPVRVERLAQALQKARRARVLHAEPEDDGEVIVIQGRERTERVPLAEVLYFRAELKYVTVRTATRSYILDESLAELEERHAARFLRIHRNALVSRKKMRALEKHFDAEEGDGWAVRLYGLDELLAVSRRQLSAVRDMLAGR